MGVMALQIANSPLYLDPTSGGVRSLRNAGFQIEGRDPCYGSGLCCALLPANTNDEVHYVTLPVGPWNATHIRLLGRFPNLKHVRANREAPAAEYDALCQAYCDESQFSFTCGAQTAQSYGLALTLATPTDVKSYDDAREWPIASEPNG